VDVAGGFVVRVGLVSLNEFDEPAANDSADEAAAAAAAAGSGIPRPAPSTILLIAAQNTGNQMITANMATMQICLARVHHHFVPDISACRKQVGAPMRHISLADLSSDDT